MGRGSQGRSPLPKLSALLLRCSDPSLHLEDADLSFACPVYQTERMIDGTLKYVPKDGHWMVGIWLAVREPLHLGGTCTQEMALLRLRVMEL